jgi:hypothetical protein
MSGYDKQATVGYGTITAGGSAQYIFGSAAIATNGWWIANGHATEDLWVSDSTVAAVGGVGSMCIPAKTDRYTPYQYESPAALSIIAATTGHQFMARKF